MWQGRAIVVLDSDDVLSRCNHKMAETAKDILGRHWDEEEISTWDFFTAVGHENHPGLKKHVETAMRSKGWCASMQPFDGAVEGVRKLQEVADVHVCTSPFGGEFWEAERRQWLYDQFRIPSKKVMQGFSKFLVRGDFFVDDKPKNIQEWTAWGIENSVHGTAYLWDRPHNRNEGGMPRVRSWGELIEHVLRWKAFYGLK
jgi:5'(3')-deoxyribonucleotidase